MWFWLAGHRDRPAAADAEVGPTTVVVVVVPVLLRK
jgi:hypothetical protein